MVSIKGQIAELYIGLLGRAADQSGFNYWIDAVDKGYLTPERLRADIVNEQTEYISGIGSMDRTSQVSALYNNLFERRPDDAGLNYWVDGDGSSVNVDQLVYALSEGASAEDRATLDKKIDLAVNYSESCKAAYDRYTAAEAAEAIDTSLPHEVTQINMSSFSNGTTTITRHVVLCSHWEVSDRDIIQSGDTATGPTSGYAGVSKGVVSFDSTDDTLIKRVYAANKAMEDTDNQSDTFDAGDGDALLFAFENDSYILISDGVSGLSEGDHLIKLTGVIGSADTDQMNIVNGDVVSLF